MKTSPTNKKIREIIGMVKENKLLPRPEFQRRLVWSRDDKNHFLDSVLRGYPFPEIYLADGDVDLDTGQGTQLLVDGLQRVSTLIQYFDGDSELRLTTVTPYRDLSENDKKSFLQYDVAVRDLGPIGKDEIIEVFKRLNATKYSLLDIEVNNAFYAGAFKKFCERMADLEFFRNHEVFNARDFKRMGDLRFLIGIVATMLTGYFNRDDVFEEVLERFNDDFPLEGEVEGRMMRTMEFIDECAFEPDSRVWKKADLFTVFVEVDQKLHIAPFALQPSAVVQRLSEFFAEVERSSGQMTSQTPIYGQLAAIYYKAALQASNDRINRIRRGAVIAGLLEGAPPQRTLTQLRELGIA